MEEKLNKLSKDITEILVKGFAGFSNIKGIPNRIPLSGKENLDELIYQNQPITLTIPNQDCIIANGVMMPKEVIQDGYKSKIGKCVDFDGNSKLVKDVAVTDKYIYVHLE